jgi:plasmid stabilization system protein ParE
MAFVRRLIAVESDIEQVLAFTRRRFGLRKYDEYGSLILEALHALEVDPQVGTRRPDIAPGAWTYHIGQPGRRARHVFIYRLPQTDVVEVLALAYDGMDLPRVWSVRQSGFANPRR